MSFSFVFFIFLWAVIVKTQPSHVNKPEGQKQYIISLIDFPHCWIVLVYISLKCKLNT